MDAAKLQMLPARPRLRVQQSIGSGKWAQQTSLRYIFFKAGQYISVNNEAKMVMIASINWEFKLFSQTLGFSGVRLTPVLYFQQPISATSICVQLASGFGDSLFYSLRYGLDGNNKKTVKVCKLYKKDTSFEEEIIPISDTSAHLLIVRG